MLWYWFTIVNAMIISRNISRNKKPELTEILFSVKSKKLF